MLVPELDVAVVDTLGDILADLMRRSAVDHVVPRPSVLSLCARGCANKQIVLQLALEVVLLNVFCKGNRDLPETRR